MRLAPVEGEVNQSTAPGWGLDKQHISQFQNGVYLLWDIVRNVTFRFTNDAGSPNAVLSGIFLSSAR